MDGKRFDALTRTMGTRRGLIGRLAGSGAAAALLGTAAVRPSGAQNATATTPKPPPTGGATFCAVGFEAAIDRGPSSGLALRGALAVSVAGDGSLTGLLLVPTGGAATPAAGNGTAAFRQLPVVGQAKGRAVNLLITVGDGQELYGVGTLEHDLGQCSGQMGGPFVGPKPGDSGDWLARASVCLSGCNKSYIGCYRGLTAAEADGAPGALCDAEFGSCATFCSVSG